MKLVSYCVKDNELNIQSSTPQGTRLGWLMDNWVIDIGFAQQWLVFFRQASFSCLLPTQLPVWFKQGQTNFLELYQMYQVIQNENPARLWIQGEPVALSVDQVQLFPPMLLPEWIFYPPELQQVSKEVHPSSLIESDQSVQRSQYFFPGLACMVEKKESGEIHFLGCSLINFFQQSDQYLPALGPQLTTTYGLKQEDFFFVVRRNGEVVDQRKLNLWESFATRLQKNEIEKLSSGAMVSLLIHSTPFSIKAEDLIEIEMEHLGQLRNRVDKG